MRLLRTLGKSGAYTRKRGIVLSEGQVALALWIRNASCSVRCAGLFMRSVSYKTCRHIRHRAS